MRLSQRPAHPFRVVVGSADAQQVSNWVLNATGVIRRGWPQVSGTESDATGYAAGVYGQGALVADIDPSYPGLEVLQPTDNCEGTWTF